MHKTRVATKMESSSSFHDISFHSTPQVIAEGLKEEEIAGLREMFESMDTDGSGTITMEELRAGLKKFGASLSEDEIEKIMEEVRGE